LEREGLTTVSLSSARDISERIRPPRTAFLNYPLGNQAGRPGDPDGQRAIVRDVLKLTESVRGPGAIVDLPYQWPDPEWEPAVVAQYRNDAGVVLHQRTEGEYQDGVNTAIEECKEVCSLV
jgi:D-proline reductase (dithiol) PrdB